MYFSALLKYLVNNHVKFSINVKTSELVSIKIGGTGKIAIFPKSIDELISILDILADNNYILLGNGTNCYFTDYNFDIPIISTKFINNVSFENNYLIAECGSSVNSICKLALKKELSGLEFAYGIPGSVGGAIYMNASAFGDSFSSVVIKSKAYDKKSRQIYTLSKEEHLFNTKSSIFQNKELLILESYLQLKNGNFEEIHKKMLTYMKKRTSTQPLNVPSAGSIFVNPSFKSASSMIDSLGLKGFSIGDAQISTKHAGFIINKGKASASDLNSLISFIKNKIKEKYNIELKEEVIFLT